MSLKLIEKALEDVRQGRMVVVVDDETRENEGDLVLAAEKAPPEAVNFMAREGRGLICVPMLGTDLDRLGLFMMVAEQQDRARQDGPSVGPGIRIGTSRGFGIVAEEGLTLEKKYIFVLT